VPVETDYSTGTRGKEPAPMGVGKGRPTEKCAFKEAKVKQKMKEKQSVEGKRHQRGVQGRKKSDLGPEPLVRKAGERQEREGFQAGVGRV